jgi:hypothetical protein
MAMMQTWQRSGYLHLQLSYSASPFLGSPGLGRLFVNALG